MSIRKSNSRKSKSKNKKPSKSMRTSKTTSHGQQIAKNLDTQLRAVDRIYQGTLGIRMKSYEVQDNKDVEINFDASNIIIDGKQYRQKNWIVVTYDYGSDTYKVKGVHMKRNYELIESKEYIQLFAEDVYPRIKKLTQQ